MENKEMIDIKKLSFGYGQRELLFADLDWQVSGGCIYGLLGKNGVGKTTLLRLITGLLFPYSGTCEVMGQDATWRLPEVLEEIYFVPEDFHTPDVTAQEYVNIYAPFFKRFSQEILATIFNEFSLSANKKLTDLSYGQKKKFYVAFGLATNCKFLILDEPTNGLDIPSKSKFRKVLASMLTQDKTFIISTHQVRDVEKLIDRVVILDDGQIIMNNSINELSQRLSFTRTHNMREDQATLYSEKIFGGYLNVEKNTGEGESEVDLEVLFNAALYNKQAMQSFIQPGV
jgi:ABC-2 type transport system ATP-binding protein